ncbi:MAG: hypothetical protein K9I68_10380 [Bacteroidales bacterium]|nr:hypothetical protein [Bacteroidales bacterium]MCF8338989.1 hypothetical protein [Bacteroidales bacterium]
MEKNIAVILSIVFHPLLIPSYLLLLFLNVDIHYSLIVPFKGKLLMVALVLLTTAVLPSFLIMIYYRMGWIKSIYMEDKKDRMLPFFTAGTVFLVAAFMLKNLQIGAPFFYLMLGVAVVTIVVMVINNFWKISAHTASMGGLLGAITGLVMNYGLDIMTLVYGVTIAGGVVGFARLKLKAHNPAQVYTGYVAGFLSMFLFFSYLVV